MNVIDLFQYLLSKKSITPDDGGILDFLQDYFDDFETFRFDTKEAKALFLTKKFGEGAHLCFSGHVDVVPPGEGWDSNPFVPKIENGFIYARGAQDMKSGVAAFSQAVKEIKKFNGRVSILLTSDEEGDGIGTQNALKKLQEFQLLPDYVIVAEPTCEEKFGDAIKIGRRGSINGVLKIFGVQGHAAYPEKSTNVIDLIAPILPKISGANLDDGDAFFAPSKFVITDIRAGMEVTNVTPGLLKMMFNVRNSTKTSKEDIANFIQKHFANIPYEVELKQSAFPFVTNTTSKVVKLMESAVKKVTNITPKYSTAGGTSDARFFGEFGIDTVEFGVKNDTIHAPNERTSIQEVEQLYFIFKEILKEF